MDKFIFELKPNTTYKVRYIGVLSDGTETSPSISYSITTPDSPTPPKVDQSLIEVDSESIPDGVVITWPIPAEDSSKPEVSDYFVQITDSLDDWQKFEVATTENKVVLTDKDHSVFWGYFAPVIYIRVFSRSSAKLFEDLDPEEYREYSYSLETELRAPDVFTATAPNAYKYNLAWAYIPERPDVVTAYKIYEASLDGSSYGDLIATITDETDYDYSSPALIALGGQTLRFAITALDEENNESNPTYSNIIRIGLIDVDFDAPPQRENINFFADTISSDIRVTWTNTGDAGDEYLNSDLSGVTIRIQEVNGSGVAIAAAQFIDYPFSYSDNVTDARVTGLLSNTRYACSLSTYDVLKNRTTYDSQNGVATPVIILTTKDTTPPPKPVLPVVAAGASIGDEPMIVRVTQESRTNDSAFSYLSTTTPGEYKMPPDLDYFEVWMFDQIGAQQPDESWLPGTAPSRPTDSSNPSNTTRIGIVNAAFDGGEGQARISVNSIQKGQQRYFYTRGVDRSGNIGEASDIALSTEMLVFGNVHINDLSADKITAGRIKSEVSIEVGPTSSNRIMIENDNDVLGKIYSGAGVWGSGSGSNLTGFYLDSFGKFSLLDTLKFNPDGSTVPNTNNPTLTLKGNIEAISGFFLGNLGVTDGAIYAGGTSAPLEKVVNGQTQTVSQRVRNGQIVIASDGIAAKDSSGTPTFLLTTSGNLELIGSILAGNAVFNQEIESTPLEISTRRYFPPTSTRGVGVNITGLPNVEIVRVGTGTNDGYLSFYRQYRQKQGISFFARSSATSDIAEMRALLEHDSFSDDIDTSGGILRLISYGTSTGNTPGRIRIESYKGVVKEGGGQEDGEIYLVGNKIYLYSEKTIPMTAVISNSSVLGINSAGRIGLYDGNIPATASIVNQTPTNASLYRNGALIAVV